MSVLNRMYAALSWSQDVISTVRSGEVVDARVLNVAGEMVDKAMAEADAALKIKTVVLGRIQGDKQTFEFHPSWGAANESLKRQVEGDTNYAFRRFYHGDTYSERAGSMQLEVGQSCLDIYHYVSEVLVAGRVFNIYGAPYPSSLICVDNLPDTIERFEKREALAICRALDQERDGMFLNSVRVRYFLRETDVAIQKIGELP